MDCMAWLPADMPPEDAQEFIDANPGDCHGAAAAAWESWAAALQSDTGMGVQSVTTGAQSVSYGDGYGSGKAGEAMRRAAWHRARSKASSVEAGPTYDVRWNLHAGLRSNLLGGRDPEDQGTIPTYPLPAQPSPPGHA